MKQTQLLLCIAVVFGLMGCASAPPIGNEVSSIRVLTFALERDVRMGGPNGAPEKQPSILGGDFEGFSKPLRTGVTDLWTSFSETAQRLTGKGPWVGPTEPGENPTYRELSEEEMDRNAMVFPPPLARSYLWPEGFRFVDPSFVDLSRLALAFPGEWFLVAQYRAFSSNAGDDTAYRKADFKMGLVVRLRLYAPSGKLWSDDTLVGYSSDSAPKLNGAVDRSLYPGLLVQAQEDVLVQWSRRPQFRMVGLDK